MESLLWEWRVPDEPAVLDDTRVADWVSLDEIRLWIECVPEEVARRWRRSKAASVRACQAREAAERREDLLFLPYKPC